MPAPGYRALSLKVEVVTDVAQLARELGADLRRTVTMSDAVAALLVTHNPGDLRRYLEDPAGWAVHSDPAPPAK